MECADPSKLVIQMWQNKLTCRTKYINIKTCNGNIVCFGTPTVLPAHVEKRNHIILINLIKGISSFGRVHFWLTKIYLSQFIHCTVSPPCRRISAKSQVKTKKQHCTLPSVMQQYRTELGTMRFCVSFSQNRGLLILQATYEAPDHLSLRTAMDFLSSSQNHLDINTWTCLNTNFYKAAVIDNDNPC